VYGGPGSTGLIPTLLVPPFNFLGRVDSESLGLAVSHDGYFIASASHQFLTARRFRLPSYTTGKPLVIFLLLGDKLRFLLGQLLVAMTPVTPANSLVTLAIRSLAHLRQRQTCLAIFRFLWQVSSCPFLIPLVSVRHFRLPSLTTGKPLVSSSQSCSGE